MSHLQPIHNQRRVRVHSGYGDKVSEFTSANVEGSAGTALWKPAGAPRLVEEVLDLFASARVTKLSECLCFDLTYSFTGNVKALTYLFKSA